MAIRDVIKEQLTRKSPGQKKGVQIFAQTHDHSMWLSGTPAKKFYYNATSFVDVQLAVQSYYQFDTINFSDDVYNFEAEALGAKLIYGENSMPAVDFREPLLRDPADLLRLKTPDFSRDGRMPFRLEVLRQTMELGFMGRLYFSAPFSLAVMLRSYPLLIRDMRRDPSFVKELLAFVVDGVLLPCFSYFHNQTGVTAFSGADAWSAFPNMSVKLLEEWVLPWNLELLQKGTEMGVRTAIVAAADYCEENPQKFNAEILRSCLRIGVASHNAPVLFLGMGRWQDYPLEPVAEYARELTSQGRKVQVVGGINANLLRNGPSEEIIRNVKRMVDTFAPEFKLTLWLSNIPADTPPEHVQAAVQATHHYGELPYHFQDDSEIFIPDERESFQQYITRENSGFAENGR
jgi:uroporphyrinogen-III decarboxylase